MFYFQVPVAKFHELRYNVAFVLKEMEDLEKRNILKIKDWHSLQHLVAIIIVNILAVANYQLVIWNEFLYIDVFVSF